MNENQNVSKVVIGASKIAQLIENINYFLEFKNLTNSEKNVVENFYQNVAEYQTDYYYWSSFYKKKIKLKRLYLKLYYKVK